MNIETKFNLGDEVWFMDNNQAKSSSVVSIQTNTNGIVLLGGGQTHISYVVSQSSGRSMTVHESKLFDSKLSLLATL